MCPSLLVHGAAFVALYYGKKRSMVRTKKLQQLDVRSVWRRVNFRSETGSTSWPVRTSQLQTLSFILLAVLESIPLEGWENQREAWAMTRKTKGTFKRKQSFSTCESNWGFLITCDCGMEKLLLNTWTQKLFAFSQTSWIVLCIRYSNIWVLPFLNPNCCLPPYHYCSFTSNN